MMHVPSTFWMNEKKTYQTGAENTNSTKIKSFCTGWIGEREYFPTNVLVLIYFVTSVSLPRLPGLWENLARHLPSYSLIYFYLLAISASLRRDQISFLLASNQLLIVSHSARNDHLALPSLLYCTVLSFALPFFHLGISLLLPLLRLGLIPVWYFHPIFSNNWFISCMNLTHIFTSFPFIFMIFLISTFHLHWAGGVFSSPFSFLPKLWSTFPCSSPSHTLPQRQNFCLLTCPLFLWLLSADAWCLSWSAFPSPTSRFDAAWFIRVNQTEKKELRVGCVPCALSGLARSSQSVVLWWGFSLFFFKYRL